MHTWLEAYLRSAVAPYLKNEDGQEWLLIILVLFVIWLLVAGRSLVVQ